MSARVKELKQMSVEVLLDKAERLMQDTANLTPRQAVTQVMPKQLDVLQERDLRTLVAEALAVKLTSRDNYRRYHVNEPDRARRASERHAARVMKHMDTVVIKRAAVLARVAYVFDDRRYSLLELPIEGHKDRRDRLAQATATLSIQREFFDEALHLLRTHSASTIAELPTQRITALGAKASEVWGE